MHRRVDLNDSVESDIVLAAMEHLNSQSNCSECLYDCGELGLLQIYWGRYGWEYMWLEIDPLPEHLGNLVKELTKNIDSRE